MGGFNPRSLESQMALLNSEGDALRKAGFKAPSIDSGSNRAEFEEYERGRMGRSSAIPPESLQYDEQTEAELKETRGRLIRGIGNQPVEAELEG